MITIEGRGFTLSELKLAGIRKKEAKGLGISVDYRRRSKSEEGQTINVDRLKSYRERLVVFPKKAGKPKAGDATVSRAFMHISPSMIFSSKSTPRSVLIDLG
jgi:large subunit ribosomal protein L13e